MRVILLRNLILSDGGGDAADASSDLGCLRESYNKTRPRFMRPFFVILMTPTRRHRSVVRSMRHANMLCVHKSLNRRMNPAFPTATQCLTFKPRHLYSALFCCFACAAVDFRRAFCVCCFLSHDCTNCTRSRENVYHNAMRPSFVAAV